MVFDFIILFSYFFLRFSSSLFCFSGGRLLNQAYSCLFLSYFFLRIYSLCFYMFSFSLLTLNNYLALSAFARVFADTFIL